MTDTPPNIVDVVRRHAAEQPSRIAFRFPVGHGAESRILTYSELDRQATEWSAGLLAKVSSGDRVLLGLADPADFVPLLFACLYAGVIAVPTPLGDSTISAVAAHQTEGILANAAPTLGITSSATLLAGGSPDHPAFGTLPWLGVGDLAGGAAQAQPASAGPAILQYTSGSTSTPRGVMVSHANIGDQVRRLQGGFQLGLDSVVASWLPLHHDMGLLTTVLAPVYAGCEAVVVRPRDFIRDPLIWLRLITQYRGTVGGAPNFAYEMCARRATPEGLVDLDLSSWRLAWNGAEPIIAETLDRFAAAFERVGFQRDSFYPCYGMAEATLMITGRQGPVIRSFSRAALESGVATAAADGQPANALTSSGRAQHGQRVLAVNPERRTECPPGTVGELWIQGPSVCEGYWQDAEMTEVIFRARLATSDTGEYLRTGDAGFLLDGELFVSGRLKDLIIIRGRNIFPQDMEISAERSNRLLRAGRSAAFGIPDDSGVEAVALVLEVRDSMADMAALVRGVRDAVALAHGVVLSTVVLIPVGMLPKTSSGKVRRAACRTAYLDGTLPTLLTDRVEVAR